MCHCPVEASGRSVLARRPANPPGQQPGVSVTDQEPDARSRRFERGIPAQVTSRVTGSIRPSGPDGRWDGRTYRTRREYIAIDRPPVSEGDRASRADRVQPRPGDRQAERLGRAGAGCARRGTPRASRSPWTTRAAATRSGSRVTVLATQSMYDGSNAAIWPRVWPWNLPNSITCARAASRPGGLGRRKWRSRDRSIGPVGVDALGGSPRTRSPRSGD